MEIFSVVRTAEGIYLINGDFRGFITVSRTLFGQNSGGLRIEGGIYLCRRQMKAEEMNAAREEMLRRLEQMRRCGVELFVDGRAALPSEAVSKAVRENSPYMADYVMDAEGTIRQVRFDRVTRW